MSHHTANPPVLEGDIKVLPMREDEAGDPLIFHGKVSSTNGEILAGATVEWWQDDADGLYSNFDSPAPAFNLRGQFKTDENGQFTTRAIVPIPYQIPTSGRLVFLQKQRAIMLTVQRISILNFQHQVMNH